MKVKESITIASALAAMIMLVGTMIYTDVHPTMKANVYSIKKLDSCGRGAISDLIKTYTQRLATNDLRV